MPRIIKKLKLGHRVTEIERLATVWKFDEGYTSTLLFNPSEKNEFALIRHVNDDAFHVLIRYDGTIEITKKNTETGHWDKVSLESYNQA